MPVAKAPSEDELRTVLEPDLNHDTFLFGKNKDNTPRRWLYKPLVWKFEKHFRRQVMPMLSASYKPFETMLSLMNQNVLTDYSPSFTKEMFEAELAEDEYLTKAVHAILLSQDVEVTVDWVDQQATSREELRAIINRQCEIHKIMDLLGESLAGKLGKLAQMMGVDIDLPTLKRLWKQVSEKLSERIMKAASTVDSASGLFSASTSETTSPLSTSLQHQESD